MYIPIMYMYAFIVPILCMCIYIFRYIPYLCMYIKHTRTDKQVLYIRI